MADRMNRRQAIKAGIAAVIAPTIALTAIRKPKGLMVADIIAIRDNSRRFIDPTAEWARSLTKAMEAKKQEIIPEAYNGNIYKQWKEQ
jgi:hypothetical protein